MRIRLSYQNRRILNHHFLLFIVQHLDYNWILLSSLLSISFRVIFLFAILKINIIIIIHTRDGNN